MAGIIRDVWRSPKKQKKSKKGRKHGKEQMCSACPPRKRLNRKILSLCRNVYFYLTVHQRDSHPIRNQVDISVNQKVYGWPSRRISSLRNSKFDPETIAENLIKRRVPLPGRSRGKTATGRPITTLRNISTESHNTSVNVDFVSFNEYAMFFQSCPDSCESSQIVSNG